MSMFNDHSAQLTDLSMDLAMLIPIGSILAWSGPTITNSELPKVIETHINFFAKFFIVEIFLELEKNSIFRSTV